MQKLLAREDLIRLVPMGCRVAELGVQHGYFSAVLNYCLQPSELVCIDAWRHFPGEYEQDRSDVSDEEQQKIYDFVSSRFAPYQNVKVVRKTTHDAAADYPDEYFDLVYVDACHLLDAVRQDLRDWYPKVKHGGMFAGHDYWDVNVPFIKVRQAVDEFVAERGLKLDYITLGHCGSWGLWKP